MKKLICLIFLSCALSGMFLALEVKNASASETVYIRADGSIDPPTANITTSDYVTYYFTENNNDEIIVEKNDTVIDAQGYLCRGFLLNGVSNVSIYDAVIHEGLEILPDYFVALNLSNSQFIAIHNATILLNGVGISFFKCRESLITESTIANSTRGSVVGILTHGCTNINITDNLLSNINATSPWANALGIALLNSSHCNVLNNVFRGTESSLWVNTEATNNVIGHNDFIDSNGIALFPLNVEDEPPSNNEILWNNFIGNNDTVGVSLDDGPYDNIIHHNSFTNLGSGVAVWESNNNTFYSNNFTNLFHGIGLRESFNNTFHHNCFVNNTENVHFEGLSLANFWDYEGEGNYWSDYGMKYPNATELDGSGIWDTPYVIDENNQDNYPLVPEFPSLIILPLFILATLLAATVYKRKSRIQ